MHPTNLEEMLSSTFHDDDKCTLPSSVVTKSINKTSITYFSHVSLVATTLENLPSHKSRENPTNNQRKHIDVRKKTWRKHSRKCSSLSLYSIKLSISQNPPNKQKYLGATNQPKIKTVQFDLESLISIPRFRI